MELLLKEGESYENYTRLFQKFLLPNFQLFYKELARLKRENQDRKITEDIYDAETISEFVYKCSRYMQEPIRQLEYSYVLRQCLPNISKKTVLDVGCGISPLPRTFAQAGSKVSGVDKIDEIIDYLNDKRSLLHHPKIHYFVADMVDLDIPENTYDYVVCISVLEHLRPKDDTKAMGEMIRILKPGGKVVVTVDFTIDENVSFQHDNNDYEKGLDIFTLKRKAKSGLKLLRQGKIKEIQKKITRQQVLGGATLAYSLETLYRQLIDPFDEYYFEEKSDKIELTKDDINRFYSSTWFEGCMYKKNDIKKNVSMGFTIEKRS